MLHWENESSNKHLVNLMRNIFNFVYFQNLNNEDNVKKKQTHSLFSPPACSCVHNQA